MEKKKEGQVIDLVKAARLLILKDAYRKHYKKVEELEAFTKHKNQGIRVVRITVGNEDWGLFTPEAYHEFKLTMSPADYHMHRTDWEYVGSYADVSTLDDVNESIYGVQDE